LGFLTQQPGTLQDGLGCPLGSLWVLLSDKRTQLDQVLPGA
jgi:hypothetical protein